MFFFKKCFRCYRGKCKFFFKDDKLKLCYLMVFLGYKVGMIYIVREVDRFGFSKYFFNFGFFCIYFEYEYVVL